MKKHIKHSVIFLIIYMFYASNSIAADFIIPEKKPIIDNETKIKILKKQQIYPAKKPVKKIEKAKLIEKEIIKEIKESLEETFLYPKEKPGSVSQEVKIEINNEIKIIEESKNKEKKVFIYPQEKPLIYSKQTVSKIKKSKILSKQDFKIAQATFEAIDKKKWKIALKLSKKVKDKSFRNLVNWLYLIKPSNNASFYDYTFFIKNNTNYPRINRLKYLAEHKINIKSNTPLVILKWFNEKDPLSDFGKIKLGELYLLQGKPDKGSQLIKEGWIKAKLSKNDLKYLRKKYKKIITVSDNIKRTDWHAWEGKHWDVQRMLRYLPKEETQLYRARQLLMSKSYGVDSAIKKVPDKFKNDIGLKYDRLKWRRKRGRLYPSLEILFTLPKDKAKLIRPDIWWKERRILSRSLIYKKDYPKAYKVASNHSMIEGPDYAEAEWLSGWIALTFMDDPNIALSHFKNFYNNVGYPISLSRGSYWLARTYDKLKNKEKNKEWLQKASVFLNTYYGQLAFIELNPGELFELSKQPQVSEKYKKYFNKNPLIKIVKLLNELDETKYSKDFIKHLALDNIENGSEILAGELSIKIGRYDYAIQIAKLASYEKRFFNTINYPVIETPSLVNNKRMPKKELVLAVIRQESEFDFKANSSVGAKGMMQLMTYTAKLVAKQAKLQYSKSRLKTDPNYNIKLGSYYLADLLEDYEGSYPFALAAYNAGPKRVKYWNKINGNPQKNKINYVDWIELIKFKETRNYVQRVLENANVYRYILSGKPVKIYNFFEDKPHY